MKLKTSLLLATLIPLAGAVECHLEKQWHIFDGKKNVKAFVFDQNHSIDLDRVIGKKGKCGDEQVIINEFSLKEKTKLGFGAGADYWFEAKLNGKIIFTTFPKGNDVFEGRPSSWNYQFTGNGKKGKNRLEIRVRRGMASWMFCLKEEPAERLDPCAPLTIEADPAVELGKIKPMNAVNNGPIKTKSRLSRGNFEAYRSLEIPYARNHDAAFCSAYGGNHTVDINFIFPDLSKDANDPASYDFAVTDHYLKTIREAGTKVFYRLGSRIEHGIKKYGTQVPPDFKKWAVICEHIIRHYNEGWANGYRWDIEYWEIWNEPDLPPRDGNPSPTWPGSKEQFFELYRTAATHLKKCFPKLKIGGPAFARLDWMDDFLSALKASPEAPLDFLSWHIYSKEPLAVMDKAQVVREKLNRHGYKKTESILNEWNYVRDWDKNFVYSIRQITGLKGAAFNAAVMCRTQNSPVDMLMYYDARPCIWNGLFEYYSLEPLKGYYAFAAWAKLVRLGRQIKVDFKEKTGIAACGAADGKGHIGILISRYFEQDDLPDDLPLTLKVKGVDLRGAKLYLLDAAHNLSDVPYRMTETGEILFSMSANSVLYLEK